MGVPYLVIVILGVTVVLGVAVGTLFLRDADGVDALLRRVEVGAGNFILATSSGPGGGKEFLSA